MTRLKKWMVRRWGWGPSDCQKREGEGERRAGTPQPGLWVETVQEAREEISRRRGKGGGWSGEVSIGCLEVSVGLELLDFSGEDEVEL